MIEEILKKLVLTFLMLLPVSLLVFVTFDKDVPIPRWIARTIGSIGIALFVLTSIMVWLK